MLPDASASRARAAIAESDAILTRLERQVEALWEHGAADAAVTWAGVAAHYASLNHPGRFASPRLERTLGEIGRHALPPGGARPGSPGRVLHVLTEAYETGGHTRLVSRWIERDAGRAHDVVLTHAQSHVPAWLRAAAEASGGGVSALTPGPARARAAELRARAANAAAVVLHIHMFDPVPLLAFADRPEGPPVIFEDHADHLFWIGTAVADVVVSLRSVAQELAVTRRGVSPDRSVLLPIPVPPVERVLTRAEAKRALGIAPDTTVLLTIAVPFKFASVVTPSWLDATAPLLRAHRDWIMLAAGPPDAGEWARAARRANGRIRPLGTVPDITNLLHAADIYVDSYPFSSNTSLIEAAGHGVPVVGFSPDPAAQAVLLSHDPGIEALIPRPATVEGFRAEVERLAAEPEAARALGERMRAGIEGAHAGPAWTERLEEVYARAAAATRPPVSPPPREWPPPAEWELVARLLFESVGENAPLEVIAAHHGATLPPSLDEALRRPPPGWDAIAVPEPTEADTLRALAALEAQARAYGLTRLALVLPPARVDALVPAIEGWLDGRDLELELLAVDDAERLVTFGRVVILAEGHPLRALAARTGALVP